MGKIKEYNVKLKSLKNTQKITKTMKMVSASKLRRAQEAQSNAKLYAENLTALTSRIAQSVESAAHPLLSAHKEVKNILILIVTSDRGLCGAFNNSANKMAEHWIADNRQQKKIHVSCCGKRGYMYFRRRETILQHYENVTMNPSFANAKKIGSELTELFLNGTVDEVYITYNQFFSPLLQKTTFDKILPIDPQSVLVDKADTKAREYLYEPPADELLGTLIPHYLYFKIYFALLENAAGEHGARMSAMDNATKNAKDLINRYTLLRNRARQAQITTELTEIVAGAEAIK